MQKTNHADHRINPLSAWSTPYRTGNVTAPLMPLWTAASLSVAGQVTLPRAALTPAPTIAPTVTTQVCRRIHFLKIPMLKSTTPRAHIPTINVPIESFSPMTMKMKPSGKTALTCLSFGCRCILPALSLCAAMKRRAEVRRYCTPCI